MKKTKNKEEECFPKMTKEWNNRLLSGGGEAGRCYFVRQGEVVACLGWDMSSEDGLAGLKCMQC